MLKDVARAVAEDIESVVREAMDRMGLSGSSLYDTLRVISEEHEGELVIGIILSSYVEYVENGRRGGKMPPTSAIEEWCKEKGIIPTSRVVFAIRKKIAEDGIRPRPFLDDALREIDSRWEKYSDAVFSEIMKMTYSHF